MICYLKDVNSLYFCTLRMSLYLSLIGYEHIFVVKTAHVWL